MHKIEQLSDQQLMKEIMSDNFKAFTELYNRYKHTLFQFVIRLSHGDYSMAEEVVQETFIIIWENRKKIVVEFSFQGYLKKVSRNLFLKETAKRIQEQLMISQIENVREAENCVEDEVGLNLLLEEVERIISMLPPARQKSLSLETHRASFAKGDSQPVGYFGKHGGESSETVDKVPKPNAESEQG